MLVGENVRLGQGLRGLIRENGHLPPPAKRSPLDGPTPNFVTFTIVLFTFLFATDLNFENVPTKIKQISIRL